MLSAHCQYVIMLNRQGQRVSMLIVMGLAIGPAQFVFWIYNAKLKRLVGFAIVIEAILLHQHVAQKTVLTIVSL